MAQPTRPKWTAPLFLCFCDPISSKKRHAHSFYRRHRRLCGTRDRYFASGELLAEHKADLTIANGENSASGFGITPRLAEELFAAGIEVISGGNHSWDRKEIFDYIPHEPRLLRPANFPPGCPGRGLYLVPRKPAWVTRSSILQGRMFMAPLDCPFRTADRETRACSRPE